ncbi:beta-mannosidase [Paenibacillus tundrae]|uniref:beta-mannosidase n=1 Tax=Paenibacillus tundrae TaxID=528187 RepID=UPI0030CA91E8
MLLSDNWRIQQYEVGEKPPLTIADADLDDRFWISASVPGDVHSTLIERKLIDHPYYGHNDINSRWVEQKEWWYRTRFQMDSDPTKQERWELIFEGLDTHATVYVNGLEIGTASNMHRTYVYDVSRVIRQGKNTIAVRFDPLYLHHRDKALMQWSSYTKERPWIRKAAMNYGWDWGPRIVTVGIWGKVKLERHVQAKLEGVYAYTKRCDNREADIKVELEAKKYRGCGHLTYRALLLDENQQVVAQADGELLSGKVGFDLQVSQPQLWWTHDLGKPYLYQLETVLYADGVEIDRKEQRIGIRTVELVLEDEQRQPAFAFHINGVKLFAKGSNWIPVDNLIGAAPDSRYKHLIMLGVEANMNMLRIWAGGIYEKDVFYDLCDELGLLVWQDFAFANALFPDYNADFVENVRQEAICNIQRLRNHASLALWCGNNEIDWLYDMKSSSGEITTPFYGETIYHEILPELLEQLDPARQYWPSSPYGGNDANDPNHGDRHNWQVWHGSVYPRKFGEVPLLDYSVEGVTFKNYKNDFTLFSSEFGMHASATKYTLERHIPEDQFYWGSVEMAYRNKDTNHQKGILLMEGFTGVPQDLDEYIQFSMLTQAEGLKYGIEHYRRNKARTSGSLIWQHGDSWPGTSWSLIDYELLPKASYYYARKFYHPLLLSLNHEPGEQLELWVINDHLSSLSGLVILEVYDMQGHSIHRMELNAEVEANGVVKLGEWDEKQVLQNLPPEQAVLKLSAPAWECLDNVYYLRDAKDVQLRPSSIHASYNEETQQLLVQANDAVARMVQILIPQGNVRMSDNYFDLLPGEQRTIDIRQADGQSLEYQHITVSALNAEEVPATLTR